MIKSPKEVKKIAEDHWKFIDGVLKTMEDDSGTVPWNTLRFLYTEAIVHGYKHCLEDAAPLLLKNNSPVEKEKVNEDGEK